MIVNSGHTMLKKNLDAQIPIPCAQILKGSSTSFSEQFPPIDTDDLSHYQPG